MSDDQKPDRLIQIAHALGIAPKELLIPSERSLPAHECLDLVRSFLSITDPNDRERVLNLAKLLAG